MVLQNADVIAIAIDVMDNPCSNAHFYLKNVGKRWVQKKQLTSNIY